MTDPARSAVMRAVRSKNTRPEMILRRLLHARGYRYRLHRKDLPGSPDLAFPGRSKAIFVHGCFWHGHDCKRGARQPRENADYWVAKIVRNRARDEQAQAALRSLGWESFIVWECAITRAGAPALDAQLQSFLGEVTACARKPA
jgi:DNA mismatch endonuclease (patch repair protein)